MSYPAQPSPQRDLVEELSILIDKNKDTHTQDTAIYSLAQSLIEAISAPEMPPANLIARVEVMILDKIEVDIDQESILSKISQLRALVSLKKDTIDQVTLHKERIKARVENYLKYPQIPIDKDSLFNSAKQLYFTGHLKDKNDLFVIHYLIQESSPLRTAIEPFNEFIINLSTETAYAALAFLIKIRPKFFELNFFVICEKLLIAYGDSPHPILRNEQIVELFLSQPYGLNDISLLTRNLVNNELPMNVINVVFEAFFNNSKTSGLLKKSVNEQAGFIIVGNKPITPYKMVFLSQAIESIKDKPIAFSRIETLKAIHPEVATIPQFIELEASITAQKAAEIARDAEKKAIDEHTGGLWRCISRKPDPSGVGYLYEFMLKTEFINQGLKRPLVIFY